MKFRIIITLLGILYINAISEKSLFTINDIILPLANNNKPQEQVLKAKSWVVSENDSDASTAGLKADSYKITQKGLELLKGSNSVFLIKFKEYFHLT
jgi:hypothetical protein